MDNFINALFWTMPWEDEHYYSGGDNPQNERKYGLSKKHFPWADIKNLTFNKAKAIYFYSIWCKIQAMRIANQKMALAIFQRAARYGVRHAAVLVQLVQVIPVTGVFDHRTMRSLIQADEQRFLIKFKKLSEVIDGA